MAPDRTRTQPREREVRSAEFLVSAVKPDHYPPAAVPEIAFAGRSNVGKSSLINTLLRRRKLVKIGSTPGRTQTINFFDIDGRMRFVDLPGYGYARVPLQVRKSWKTMIETYLRTRQTLSAVVLLCDLRRPPEKEELELQAYLGRLGIPVLLVATKADKLSRARQRIAGTKMAEVFGVSEDKVLLFSSKSGQGRQALWEAMEAFLGPDPSDRVPTAEKSAAFP